MYGGQPAPMQASQNQSSRRNTFGHNHAQPHQGEFYGSDSPNMVSHLLIYQSPACSTDPLTILTAVQGGVMHQQHGQPHQQQPFQRHGAGLPQGQHAQQQQQQGGVPQAAGSGDEWLASAQVDFQGEGGEQTSSFLIQNLSFWIIIHHV